MKKVLSIAIIAATFVFGFVSCKEHGDDPQPAKFKFDIKVSDISALGATVTVIPSDTNEYYFFDLRSAAAVDYYNLNGDSIAAAMKADFKKGKFKFPKFLSRGIDSYTWEDALSPNTEFVAFAVRIDSNYNAIDEWTTIRFKTPEMTIKETKQVTAEGSILDATAIMGTFQVVLPIDQSGAFLQLTFDGESAEGTFTENNTNIEFGSWEVIDASKDEAYPIVTANVTGAYKQDGTYAISGEVISYRGIKYVINTICHEEELPTGAPAKFNAPIKADFGKTYISSKF